MLTRFRGCGGTASAVLFYRHAMAAAPGYA